MNLTPEEACASRALAALAADYKRRMDAINGRLFTSITPARLAEMCRKKALADEAVRQARVLLYPLANEPEIVRHLATGHPTGSIDAVKAAKTRLERDMRAQIQRLAVACREGSLASAQTEWSVADASADEAADEAAASASADAALADAAAVCLAVLDDMKRIAALLATCSRLLVAFANLKGKIGHPHAHEALIGYIVFGFDRPDALAAAAAAQAQAAACATRQSTVTLMSPSNGVARASPAALALIAVLDAESNCDCVSERTSPISADPETTTREHADAQTALNTAEMIIEIAESMATATATATATARVWQVALGDLSSDQCPEELMRVVALFNDPEKSRDACHTYHVVPFFSLDLWAFIASAPQCAAPQLHDGDIELFLASLESTVDLIARREGTPPGEYDYFTLADLDLEPHAQPQPQLEAQLEEAVEADPLEAQLADRAPKRQCLGLAALPPLPALGDGGDQE